MGVNPTKHPGDLKRPIDNISWYDAILYCNALSKRDGLDPVYTYSSIESTPENGISFIKDLNYDIKKNGYRLLTSAEYEFVVRAETTTTWFFADKDEEQDNAKEYAWCDRNAGGETHPVGTLKANKYGVYDITAICGCGVTIGMMKVPTPILLKWIRLDRLSEHRKSLAAVHLKTMSTMKGRHIIGNGHRQIIIAKLDFESQEQRYRNK
jgi:hypothetical protein